MSYTNPIGTFLIVPIFLAVGNISRGATISRSPINKINATSFMKLLEFSYISVDILKITK